MTDIGFDKLRECAVAAAQAGGKHALDHYARRTEADHRYAHDLKLRLDVESQARCEAVIRAAFPAHAIFGEEGGPQDEVDGYRWVIDPIDGTVNFSHGLPLWCCSVGVQHRGRHVAGAVFLPMLGELYCASLEHPSACNGRPIRVSDTATLQEAIVYTGILRPDEDRGISARAMDLLAARAQKVRLLGSAAIELCYVACGRGAGYFETAIHLWDLAAGWLLIEQAGGRCEILEKVDPICYRFAASNGRIHDELRATLREAMR